MFLLKPLFDCFCWSAARLPHSTSCCRGRCSIASLDKLLLALVLKHTCAEALAVQSLSIPNRWAVPLITAGSCQSRDFKDSATAAGGTIYCGKCELEVVESRFGRNKETNVPAAIASTEA